MKKAAVIYKSKYGFTEKYARWIAQELGADLIEAGKVKPAALPLYDVIVYGGGLYAGGVNGLSVFKKIFPFFKNRPCYLFTVGAANVREEANLKSIRLSLKKALSPEMEEKLHIFHVRGGIDYSKLSLLHRVMMGMMARMIRKKPEAERSGEEKDILETYGGFVDFTDKAAIGEMVDRIKADLAE